MTPKKKAPAPPAPPKSAVKRVIADGVTMPDTVRELIDACGMLAVFIPTRDGIRFFVVQSFTPTQAEEFATILEDCANNVRGMFRPTGDKIQ